MKLQKGIVVLFVLLFCCLLSPLQAQGMKVFGAVGYGLGLSGNQFASSAEYEIDLTSNYYYYYEEILSRTDHYFNFGKGIKFGGGIEIPVRPHVSLRLEGNFWKMPEINAVSTVEGEADITAYIITYYYWYGYLIDIDVNPVPGTASMNGEMTNSFTASLWNVDAVLLLDTQLGDKTLYAGAGVGLFNATMTRKGDYSMESSVSIQGYPQYNYTAAYTEEQEEDYTFKSGIGFVGVLGVEMPLNEKTFFFAEVNLHAVGFEIEKMELEGNYEEIENGVVVEHGDFDSETEYEKDDPDEEAPWTMPGTSATVRAGIKMGLN